MTRVQQLEIQSGNEVDVKRGGMAAVRNLAKEYMIKANCPDAKFAVNEVWQPRGGSFYTLRLLNGAHALPTLTVSTEIKED